MMINRLQVTSYYETKTHFPGDINQPVDHQKNLYLAAFKILS